MATGTLLILPAQGATPPATAFATQDTMPGASTPAEAFPVLDFDAAVTEYADWHCVLPTSYAGGGLTITIVAVYPTTTGGVQWEIAIRRLDAAEDTDTTAHTYDYNGVAVTTLPATVGLLGYHNVTFTSGADMDSLAAGEAFVLRLRRVFDDADDTMTGDASLYQIHVKET